MQFPDQPAVLNALNDVLKSRQFCDAPMLQELLLHLIEMKLQNRADKLTVNDLARDFFGRGDDFDNRFDSIVRVNMLRLRNALTMYYSTEGLEKDVEINICPGNYAPEFQNRKPTSNRSHYDEAISVMAGYQQRASPTRHEFACRVMDKALQFLPEDADLLANRAELFIDAYSLGFGGTEEELDRARQLTERASELDGNLTQVKFVNGLLALMDGNVEQVRHFGVELKCSKGEDNDAGAFGDWLVTIATEPSESAAPAFESDQLSDLPGWIHHPFFLHAYEAGDYELALDAAIAFGMPDYFWGPMNRAAVMGQLGLRRAAERELSRAINLNPNLENNSKLYLSKYIPFDNVVAHLNEGLEKAGLRNFAN